jgi:hypothetical protein
VQGSVCADAWISEGGYMDVLDLELTWTFIEREADSLRRVADAELEGAA